MGTGYTTERTYKMFIKLFNPIALRRAKIAYNFGLSECNRVKRAFSSKELKLDIFC